MKIKATVLAENSVFSNLGAIAEHGWSVFIETEHGNLLFDTGQGLALPNNAKVLGKDLSSLKSIILSHHHVDHTGGLLGAIKGATHKPIEVYAHPGLFNQGYLARNGRKYIGVPFCREALESAGANFNFSTVFREIAPDIYLTGEVPRTTDFEFGDNDILLKTPDGFIKDTVQDDQSIVIKTTKGLAIILGCAHAGIINILNYAREKTGESRIHAIIGGTHLWSVSQEQQDKSIEALSGMDIERLGVSHCTGFDMSMRLAQVFQKRFFMCNVGTVLELS